MNRLIQQSYVLHPFGTNLYFYDYIDLRSLLLQINNIVTVISLLLFWHIIINIVLNKYLFANLPVYVLRLCTYRSSNF